MSKRIMLMPSPPSSGSVGSTIKCIGIARVLRSQGHEVCFVIGGKLKELVENEGFFAYDYPTPITIGNMQDINSVVDFLEWTGMTDSVFADQSVYAEIEAIKDFRPDVVFAETRLSASISVKVCGIPAMMIAAWPCHPDFPLNKNDRGRLISHYNSILSGLGMKTVEHLAELLFLRADIKISPSIQALEPELAAFPDIEFAGYILDVDTKNLDIGENDKQQKDIILVYLSVGAITPDLYRQVITDTFKNTQEHVICCCGYHYQLKNELNSDFENIRFEQYVNLYDIIQRVKLIIFHGGQDTMLMSLLYGIPNICIPGKHFEREYNCNQLTRLGVSERLPTHGFRPNRLKKAIADSFSGERLLRCQDWKEMMKQYSGTTYCVNRLIDLAEKSVKNG